MPTFRHGKKTAILYRGFDLSPYMNSAGISNQLDLGETTTFSSDSKTYITGLESGTISLSGLFEGLVEDPTLQSALNNDLSITVATGTSSGTNSIVYTHTSTTPFFAIGQKVTVSGTTKTIHNTYGIVTASSATGFTIYTVATVTSDTSTGGVAVSDGLATVTVAQEGLTVNTNCTLANTRLKTYEIKSAVADVISVSAELEVDSASFAGTVYSGVETAKLLTGATTVTSATTTTGTTVDSGIVAGTSKGYVAHLHVTANTWTGITTVKISHSSDGSTWTDLDTFEVIPPSTPTSARLVNSSATVNRYVRALVTTATGSGSITYTIALSRR